MGTLEKLEIREATWWASVVPLLMLDASIVAVDRYLAGLSGPLAGYVATVDANVLNLGATTVLFAVGMLVGIRLIFSGWSIAMLGVAGDAAVEKAASEVATQEEA